MATTVISAFADQKVVQQVVNELLKAGLQERDVQVLKGDEDELVAEIVGRGFGEDDAREFAQATSEGKTLVAASASAGKLDRAVAIMERYEAQDEEDEDEDREERGRGEETLTEVEEELSVGKRRVAKGGVRVTNRVSEQPVEKTVSLREERVKVDREEVDREANEGELETAFEEKTVEMLGTAEEVEVRKQARVVEEVSLGKEAVEREKTVRDTVRRNEVEVEEIEPANARKRR